MTNIEIGDLAGDVRLAAREGGDLTVMLGSKNLTRDGLIISLRSAKLGGGKNDERRAPAVWRATRPEIGSEKQGYLLFFEGLSSFAGFAGF